MPVSYDNFEFTGEHLTVSEYAEKMEQFKSKGIFEYNGFHYVLVRSFYQEEIDMLLLILPIPKQPLRQYISRNLVQKIVMLPVPNH